MIISQLANPALPFVVRSAAPRSLRLAIEWHSEVEPQGGAKAAVLHRAGGGATVNEAAARQLWRKEVNAAHRRYHARGLLGHLMRRHALPPQLCRVPAQHRLHVMLTCAATAAEHTASNFSGVFHERRVRCHRKPLTCDRESLCVLLASDQALIG